jgi:hypothetical protein
MDMPRYDQMKVPSGPTRKWEIVIDDARERETATLTAVDVKNEHRVLRDIAEDDLRELPLVPVGAFLERGEWYLDLHNPARGEFPGNGREHVRPGQRVIARSAASRDLWRRLVDACDDVLGRRRSSPAA